MKKLSTNHEVHFTCDPVTYPQEYVDHLCLKLTPQLILLAPLLLRLVQGGKVEDT